MHEVLWPNSVSCHGLSEASQDKTAPEGWAFFHANEGEPLATPWQVAIIRASMLATSTLGKGWIVDCACGSGIQLAAYASFLNRPVLGVELDEMRARASALNLATVAQRQHVPDAPWLENSRFLIGDGTLPQEIFQSLGGPSKIAFLHLDPARPRNSQAHDLSEMQPPVDIVLDAWAPYFSETPAILLDLSPRLNETQRSAITEMILKRWPGIDYTWEWTSRGKGRVDRLAVWIGSIAAEQQRRFLRIPPTLAQRPFVLTGGDDNEETKLTQAPPMRGEYVSIIDAALVESGCAMAWLRQVTNDEVFRWAFADGRRPQVHHTRPLHLFGDNVNLIQATGRVVDLMNFELNLETIDNAVQLALEYGMRSVKLRLDLDPALQPLLQGSFDRQLQRRHGTRHGFLCQHPNMTTLLLCIEQAE